MVKRRKAARFLAVLVTMVLLSGCSADKTPEAPEGQQQVLTLKLGHAVSEQHPYHLGAEKFKEIVEKETGGGVEVKLYPNNQLGSGERDLIEGLQLGTVDLVVTSTGPLSGFEKKFMLLTSLSCSATSSTPTGFLTGNRGLRAGTFGKPRHKGTGLV